MEQKLIKTLYLVVIITQFILMIRYNEYYQSKKEIIKEESSIEFLLNKTINPNIKEENIIAYEIILEIPKINLKKGILSKDDEDNNIEKNVTILKESKYPNERGNVFLVAHSGNGNKSFFNDLVKLSLSDEAYLYYDNVKYSYEVINIKEIDKNSQLILSTSTDNGLILITCSQKDKTKYLVITLDKQKETEL